MDVRINREYAHVIVTVSGELTQQTQEELAHQLRPLVDGDAWRLVVDLSDLKFIDSSGIGCLVDSYARANMHGCRMILVNPSPFVSGVLEHTRLVNWFEICSSLTEAAKRFSEKPP